MDDKDQEIEKVRAEEERRGRRPKRTTNPLVPEQARKLKRIAMILADPKSSFDSYLEVIRTLQLPHDSDEYHDLVALWKRLRGSTR